MRRIFRSNLFVVTLFLAFTSLLCQHAFANPEDFQKLWYTGSMPEALALAKTQKKPILLYWGATWCPPCNELKAQVFSHPDFAAVTAPLVRVYLDGDKEEAQDWGEKLHASGYPTILLLSPEGKEFLRIATSVDWDEFKQTVQHALAGQGTFDEALKTALKEDSVPESIWHMLAYSSWGYDGIDDATNLKLLLARERLIAKIPPGFAAERALFIAGLVDAASSESRPSNPEAAQLWKRVDANALQYISFILSQKSTIWANRESLVYNADAYLKWIQSHCSATEFAQLSLRWIRAAEFIRTRKKASTEIKLSSLQPSLVIAKMFSTDKEKSRYSPTLKEAVSEAAKAADRSAKTPYERHSVISNAAQLLEEVGEIEAARQLLVKELAHTDTPWYYQSSLASLEEKAAHRQDALNWSHLAKESARGNATRLQWITSDLLLNLRLAPGNAFKINKLLREYYDLAFSLSDGFKGRNASRARQVVAALGKLEKTKLVLDTVKFYQERCSLSQGEAKTTCQKLFASRD